MSETDEIHQAITGSVRVALTVAGQVGEQIAREVQRRAHVAQAATEQNARELQARFDAERAAARAQLAVVHRGEWWERARPQDVGRAWEVANAWAPVDLVARDAAETIRERVREQFGIDATTPDGDPAAVESALKVRSGEEAGESLVSQASALSDEQVQRARLEQVRAAGTSVDLYAEQEQARRAAAVALIGQPRAPEQAVEDLALRAQLDASMAERRRVSPDFASHDYLEQSVSDALTARALAQLGVPRFQDMRAVLEREWARLEAEAQADRDAAQRERTAARVGERQAQTILAETNVSHPGGDVDQEVGMLLYDSAERRQALAVDLEHAGVDAESIEARVVADRGFGTPARDAVAMAPTKAPRVRKMRSLRGREQTRTLDR